MREKQNLKTVSDDDLLRRLSELLRQSRRVEADLVAHIAEVDARRLYAREAASSMFAYCTEVLHLSEPEAYLRIAVARASRRHPVLLTMLADGRLHLSGIERLAPHLTEENREALLKRAAHRSRRADRGARRLSSRLARRSPPSMRKLPESRGVRRRPRRPSACPGTPVRDGVGSGSSDARSGGRCPRRRLAASRLSGRRTPSRRSWRFAQPCAEAVRGDRARRAGPLPSPLRRQRRAARQAGAAPGPDALLGARRGPGQDHRRGGDREARTARSEALREDEEAPEEPRRDGHHAEVAPHPGGGEARRARARRRPLHLPRQARETLHQAPRSGVPPPRALRPGRRPQCGDDLPHVPDAQHVDGRAATTERR